MIPYGRQHISEEDVEAVVRVLRSDFLTQGPVVPAFEEAVAAQCGAGFAVAVNSATSALHLACLALDVGAGDWVWTTPITFAASANCALYCGARVDFVDINPATYNLSVERLEEKLIEARASGRLPKVVVPVHLAGQSCEMAAIHRLSREYGFRVVEDASHAIGGTYRDSPVGRGDFSDITVFSFHPVKIITSAEGGMALTNDAALAERMRRLRSHGMIRDVKEMARVPDGGWYYEQIELGFNYRMTDVHAALGLSQLSRLTTFVEARRGIARRYNDAFSALPVRTPWVHPDCCSSFHLYVIRVDTCSIARTHAELFDTLRHSGIGVNLHYIPVYRHPFFARMGFDPKCWPESERYYSEAITLPIYPTLSEEDQQRVIDAVADSCEL